MGSYYVAQAGLRLLGSSHPPASDMDAGGHPGMLLLSLSSAALKSCSPSKFEVMIRSNPWRVPLTWNFLSWCAEEGREPNQLHN